MVPHGGTDTLWLGTTASQGCHTSHAISLVKVSTSDRGCCGVCVLGGGVGGGVGDGGASVLWCARVVVWWCVVVWCGAGEEMRRVKWLLEGTGDGRVRGVTGDKAGWTPCVGLSLCSCSCSCSLHSVVNWPDELVLDRFTRPGTPSTTHHTSHNLLQTGTGVQHRPGIQSRWGCTMMFIRGYCQENKRGRGSITKCT